MDRKTEDLLLILNINHQRCRVTMRPTDLAKPDEVVYLLVKLGAATTVG